MPLTSKQKDKINQHFVRFLAACPICQSRSWGVQEELHFQGVFDAALLDPTRTGVTLDSLQRAALALGLTLNISFEPPARRPAARAVPCE